MQHPADLFFHMVNVETRERTTIILCLSVCSLNKQSVGIEGKLTENLVFQGENPNNESFVAQKKFGKL